MELEISNLSQELQTKADNLKNEKVLKTVIGFYSKNDEEKYRDSILAIRNRLGELEEQKVTVVSQQSSTQKIVD